MHLVKTRPSRSNVILAALYLGLFGYGVLGLHALDHEAVMLVYFLTLPWNLVFTLMTAVLGLQDSKLASFTVIYLAGGMNFLLILWLPFWRKTGGSTQK